MFWIIANNPDHAFSLYDLALVTDFFYRRTYFHDLYLLCALSYFARYVILPRLRSYGENCTVTLSPGKIFM